MSKDIYFTVVPCNDNGDDPCVYEGQMFYTSPDKFERLHVQATHVFVPVESEVERARHYLMGTLQNWEEKHNVR